ncbi:hypothetical protein FACS189451_09040 [Bacteroidia bacterium]|nr:hypothetical protein FACS189451_09040 [Bacteroidia bacterium]GHU79616.1 hypothetical protein FACS1894145_4140 [Bacteroidia bacterium]
MVTNLSKNMSDKVGFISFIVPYFAETYKMNPQNAYFYLKKYGGWDFLNKHWWALHTDNPFYTVDYLYRICYQNGGLR